MLLERISTLSSCSENTWVFAYGSNLHLGDLGEWLTQKDITSAEVPALIATLRSGGFAARLPGFRLRWNYYADCRQSGVANVEPSESDEVYGVAYAVDERWLELFDHKEGHPTCYLRKLYDVENIKDGTVVKAWVYSVQPEWTEDNDLKVEDSYRNLILEGAQEWGLPASYIEAIRSI